MTVNPGVSTNRGPAVLNERGGGTTPSDTNAIRELRAQTSSQSPVDQELNGQPADNTFLTAINHSNNTYHDTPLRLGKVTLSLPYLHCYRVQLSGRQGTCMAAALTQSSLSPIGVKAGDTIPPGSTVIVWKPKGASVAYIVGVLPPTLTNDSLNGADEIQQGGNSGPKKVEAYRNLSKVDAASLGAAFPAGRPIDGTNNEYVRMSETGIGLLIDSFQAYLRVNEACGVWFNYFDSYTKLAGMNLEVQSFAEHTTQLNDEGELYNFKGVPYYPWEAVGLYTDGSNFTKQNSASDVQLNKNFPFAEIDLQSPDQQAIYRYVEYSSFIGQGFTQYIIKPLRTSGLNKLTDQTKDVGLFHSNINVDGSYFVNSAKSINFFKYPIIPVPRRKKPNADATGDDLKAGNYKFSGKFGNGPNQQVKDWDDTEVSKLKALMPIAGMLDTAAHLLNWKANNAFEYHSADFDLPEESEAGFINRVAFHRGTYDKSYVDIEPQKLEVDHRTGETKVYNTAAFFRILEDGSVVIGDGYGAQITLTGGQIRLESGGDIVVTSGSRVVTLAREAVIRAKENVDISASDNDVRIKAERNLQMLAGNSGSGGVLIESKGQGDTQNYNQKIGNEVQSSGITLLSRSGCCNLLSRSVYVRSGVDEGNAEGYGEIILDSANGRSNLTCYSRSQFFFNSQGLGIWHSPTGAEGSDLIKKGHFFGPNVSKIIGPLAISKDVVITDQGNLLVDNGIYSTGNIIAVGQMGCKNGFPAIGDSSKNNIPTTIQTNITTFKQSTDELNERSKTLFTQFFTEGVWSENKAGNTALLNDQIGFSFRDESASKDEVYGYAKDQFFFLETRWQQLDRMKLTQSSNIEWEENAVSYQSQDLYPWPGKKNWVDNSAFLRYRETDDMVVFDTAKYSAKDRQTNKASYELPKFTDWSSESCDKNFKL